MTHTDDLEALAAAVGVLHHPEPPITLRDIAAGFGMAAGAWCWLTLGAMLP